MTYGRKNSLRSVVAYADNSDSDKKQATKGKLPDDDVDEGLIGAVGTWILWGGLIAYALQFAPNQTPLRDSYFLEKLLGLGTDDGVQINTIFASIFYLAKGFPALYLALLIPSARNGNKVPLWPFLVCSFGLGSLALLPYFALWEPSSAREQASLGAAPWVRVTESKAFAAMLLGLSAFFFLKASLAGGAQWYEFGRLLEESRLVHTSTLDFLTLSFALPFWVYTDATARGFKQQQLLPALVLLPAVGPALYLLLRPEPQR